jgi:hypothetical protein
METIMETQRDKTKAPKAVNAAQIIKRISHCSNECGEEDQEEKEVITSHQLTMQEVIGIDTDDDSGGSMMVTMDGRSDNKIKEHTSWHSSDEKTISKRKKNGVVMGKHEDHIGSGKKISSGDGHQKRRRVQRKRAVKKGTRQQRSQVPALQSKYIENMLQLKQGYHYQFSHSLVVPYVLPPEKMQMACRCGVVYKPTTMRHHVGNAANCPYAKKSVSNDCGVRHRTIVKDSDRKKSYFVLDKLPNIESEADYDALSKNPQYASNGSHLILRAGNIKTFACICGFMTAFDSLTVHWKTCELIEKWNQEYLEKQKIVCSKSKCVVASPFIEEYTSSTKTLIQRMVSNSHSVSTKRDFELIKPYGENDDSVNIYIPKNNELQNKDIRNLLFDLDASINKNWNALHDTVLEQVSLDEEDESKGRLIQGGRVEIHLSFNGCTDPWSAYCKDYAFDDEKNEKMKAILKFVEEKTIDDVGEERFFKGTIGTPSLIICKTGVNQGWHLDIMGGTKRKQYGMIVSNQSSSTLVAASSDRKDITTLKEVCYLFTRGTTLMIHGETEEEVQGKGKTKKKKKYNADVPESIIPCESLLSKIKALTEHNSEFVKSMKEGYVNLFRICRTDIPIILQSDSDEIKKVQALNSKVIYGKKKEVPDLSKKSYPFNWISNKVCDAPPGTIIGLSGGVIHAGCGAEHNSVRTILFWTWSENSVEEYDSNVQKTKLSLMVELAIDLWKELDANERKHMVGLMYYAFVTSEDAYQESASGTFKGMYNGSVEEMVKKFVHLAKKTAKQIDRLFTEYGNKTDLFIVRETE